MTLLESNLDAVALSQGVSRICRHEGALRCPWFTRTLFGQAARLTHLPGIRQVALLGHCIVISASRSFNSHAVVYAAHVSWSKSPSMIARSSSLTKLPTHAAFVNLRRAFDDNEHRIVLDKMIYLNPCPILLTGSGSVRLPA